MIWCRLVLLSISLGPGSGGQTGESRPLELVRGVRLSNRASHPGVVVTRFFTGGRLSADGRDLAVTDGKGEPVAWRLLQHGPGDFARVAFLPRPDEDSYLIRYGVVRESVPPERFHPEVGLLVEVREWSACDLDRLQSVREGYEKAKPMGADFVPGVYWRRNPVDPVEGPFFSRFRGTLEIPRAGVHRFFTSSQDCSFLLIDGKEVVSWPGAHGPVGDARVKGEVELLAGRHEFEYLHASGGNEACMVAAWQPPGVEKPEPIPPAAFGWERVENTPAIGPFLGGDRRMHDFVLAVEGEVPLEEPAPPMIRVRFDSAQSGSKHRWDFGDGQTSSRPDPTHIYLHPGMYRVRLSVAGEPEALDSIQNVWISRPVFSGENAPRDVLSDYLPVVARYDAEKLDAPGLVQLLRALEAGGEVARLIEIGSAWLTAESPSRDDASVLAAARLVGPLVRDGAGDSERSLPLWRAGEKSARAPSARAECLLQVAEIALHDLHRVEEAKAALGMAEKLVAIVSEPRLGSRLNRLRGDVLAREGERMAARAAYGVAAELAARASGRTSVEREAWRGAWSRSAEAFLRAGELDQAREVLRTWYEEDPGAIVDGYLPWLQARLWVARDRAANALGVAADLLALNPESAYADRMLMLISEAQHGLGQAEQSRAALERLLREYPGSPLIPEVRRRQERELPSAGSVKP